MKKSIATAATLVAGTVYNVYLPNGEAAGQMILTRFNDKSVWVANYDNGKVASREYREAINTHLTLIQDGRRQEVIEAPVLTDQEYADTDYSKLNCENDYSENPLTDQADEIENVSELSQILAGANITAAPALILPGTPELITDAPAIITELQMPSRQAARPNRNAASKLATQLNSDLAWDVVIEPVTTASGIILPGYKALTRSDNQGVLNVAKETYTPTMNSRFKDVVNQLSEITGFSVAGYDEFRDGKQIFGYLKSEQNGNMLGFDHEEYMVVGNSHDGKTGFFVGTSSIMIRCMNQFSRINQKMKVYHTKSNDVKIEELLQYFRSYQVERAEVEREMERFAKIKVSDKILVSLTERLFDVDSKKVEAAGTAEDAKISPRKKNLMDAFAADLATETADLGKTLFGFFHGATRYTTHTMVTDKPFGNIAGYGFDMNNKALAICQEYAKA